MNDGLTLLASNWLLIALLGVFFFFGDWIYNALKELTKDKTKTVIGDFFLLIIVILILSLLPLIISQLMIQLFPLGANIFISILLLGICFWKYYSED